MKRADLFLIVILFVISIFIFLSFKDTSNPESVVISSGGEIIGTYSINENNVLNISGTLGDVVVNIEDRQVWVSESNCKDLLEIKQGKISKCGQSLVCVPNKVVISIIGREAVESVTY